VQAGCLVGRTTAKPCQRHSCWRATAPHTPLAGSLLPGATFFFLPCMAVGWQQNSTLNPLWLDHHPLKTCQRHSCWWAAQQHPTPPPLAGSSPDAATAVFILCMAFVQPWPKAAARGFRLVRWQEEGGRDCGHSHERLWGDGYVCMDIHVHVCVCSFMFMGGAVVTVVRCQLIDCQAVWGRASTHRGTCYVLLRNMLHALSSYWLWL